MTSAYESYLEYLGSFANSHSLAVQAETNIYPMFADIKKVIGHYQNTIEKFPNVQSELASFVERLEFDENDFDYYQDKFIELRKVDDYLNQLKLKKVSASISTEIQSFITTTYSSASLYSIDKIEEQVLSYHNKAADMARQKTQNASTVKTIIILLVIVLFITVLISKCHT